MYCPVLKSFLWEGHTCMLTQLYGENKNRLFYGPDGHSGVDMKTIGSWKYKRDYGKWTKIDRSQEELDGRIPLVACCSGTVRAILHDDKKGWGWGVELTSDLQQDGEWYKILYWHIETPWSSLRGFRWKDLLSVDKLRELFVGRYVKKGSIIAIGGNNGKSTGPHLHFQVKKKVGNEWVLIDPMPLFQDKEVVYHMYYGPGHSRWFYKGKEKTRAEVDSIIADL